MKKTFCLVIILLSAVQIGHAQFRAGAAVRIVTPDPLLPVCGGVGPSNPATRALGDLSVRALVLSDGDTQLAIVGADFLGFPSPLCDRVKNLVKTVPRENIVIGVTHTHSAPDCYGFPDDNGNIGADLIYLNFVCRKMAEAIDEAAETAKPAVLKIATGKAAGKIAYNAYAEELYDRRCHVLQVIEKNGVPIATLVNYAIHPEVLGSDMGVLSPDLCGPLYDRIEKNGGGLAIFMNSAQGGMVTADCRGADGRDVQMWDECVRIGTLLADEAQRIVKTAPVQEHPRLFCTSKRISFPVESPVLRQVLRVSPIAAEMGENDRITTQVHLLNIGNAQILTIPGEALPNIGFYLKRKMNGEHNFLFGLTNDGLGYILTRVDWNSFERYDYITRICLGEMTGEIFIEEALELVEASPPAK